MQKISNQDFLYSPSDLVTYVESPFASIMDRLVCEGKIDKKLKNNANEDAAAQLVIQRGFNHEHQQTQKFKNEGKRVLEIDNKAPDKQQTTLEAMQQGYGVIVQAYLVHESFAGFADFLVKVQGQSDLGNYYYEVWDTKLAHSAKPAYLIQLCCYAEILKHIQGNHHSNLEHCAIQHFKAINHLLLTTMQYCQDKGIKAHFVYNREDDALKHQKAKLVKNTDLHKQVQHACVLGTTAWGFAREDMINQLDYLFVDEAGQVAVANLIAMSRSAKNLILMGDQMQLGQPTQGSHPLQSGLSILDYFLGDMPTIANEMGVFLGESYRMHPFVNQFASDYIYDGKLHAHADNVKQRIHVPSDYQGELNKEAGIIFVPVEHQDNKQASDEEVNKILQLVDELLQRQLTTKQGETRPVTLEDMLFIAPYNHQVRKLQDKLGSQAKVGSVDKFQGQEAPIVFLSLCSSDANDSPRGLEFIFNKHRLNVAISRAKSLAIVVANPQLAITHVNTVEQLKMVNLVAALFEYSC